MADNKDLVRRVGGYSGDESGSHVVYDSRHSKSGQAKKDLGSSEGADKVARILNEMNKNSDVVRNEMGIWRGVTGGYGANVHGQQAIEGLMQLKNMKKSADLIVYDTETLGTAPFQRQGQSNLDFYTPTEIGFKHVKLVNGQLSNDGKSLSMLMRPDEEVYKRLNGLINGVSNGNWTGMTDDVRRTLSDLTLYAGDPGQLFKEENKDGRRVVSVNKQARELHPLKGSVLTSSQNIAAMRGGLENLMKMGTTTEDAIMEMNAFMKGMQDTKFAGYNVYNFDQPMMMDFLNNQIGKHAPNSQVGKALSTLKGSMALNQIDGLHAVRTLYRDTYSRYGDNVTLETMKDTFNMNGTGQSHHALSDVNVTIEQLNRLMGDKDLNRVLSSGGKKGNAFGRFDATPISVGDRLFGVAGMNSSQAGAYDGVYRRKDGKLHSAYDMKPNPLYRNATYEVQRFFDGVKIDGKNMFGMELYNETDDLVHTIFRETQGELQNAVHKHLQHIDEVKPAHRRAAQIQNEDRGMRRWRKMFSTESGGGVNLTHRMYEALDVAREGEKAGLKPDEIKRNILAMNEWNTDEFVRDFQTIRGRLQSEEKWVRGFLEKVKDSAPGIKKGTLDTRAQSLALAEFGKLMEGEFGKNEGPRALPNGGRALPLVNGEGEKNYIQLNNADGVRGSLYGHLYQGHSGKPNTGELRKRYRDLLMQLKSLSALDAKKFEQFYKGIDGVGHTKSFDNMLGELANTVMQAHEKNRSLGINTITVEDPTKVRGNITQGGTRGNRLRNEHGSLFDVLANQAIEGTKPYSTVSGNGKKMVLHGGALAVIEEHDAAIKKLLEGNNVKNPNLRSAATSLQNLVGAYETDFNVQIRYDQKSKGLQMVLADKAVSEAILDGSMKDIMKSHGTAVIQLPHMNADGTISRGSQNRVARLAAKRKQGGYEYTTAFDDIISTLTSNVGTVKRMMTEAEADGTKGVMNSVHGFLNRRAGKAMQNLSMNNRFTNPADAENMFAVSSSAANWVRGGAIDVSDMAEEWYEGWYKGLTQERKDLYRVQTPDKVREKAAKEKGSFVQHMGMMPERFFHREVDEFANQKLGTNLGMHSIKDTHVANYLRANRDIRELHAFGYFNPMARENVMKTVNYMALDKDDVRTKLAREGYSSNEIERMLDRGVATDRGQEVFEDYKKGADGGKVSYLNMRAAYMNGEQLSTRAAELVTEYEGLAAQATGAEAQKYQSYVEKLKNAQAISTFDGMMIMSDKAGRAFDTTREKSIKLSPGAQLTQEMKDLLESSASRNDLPFDLSKDMVFDKNMAQLDRANLYAEYNAGNNVDAEAKAAKRKSITVSEIVKNDIVFDEDGEKTVTHRSVDKKLDKWNNANYYVKGWNAEEQRLILEERVKQISGSKHLTDAGDRLTATILPDELVSRLGGAENGQRISAIMPSFEAKKGMHGGELKKVVELAVDEARAQIDGSHGGKLTPGSIAKEDALQAINRMFQDSFNIQNESLSSVQGGRIVVDRLIGTNDADKKMDYSLANVNKFLSGVDEMLGTKFADGKTIMGNVGIGKQNIHDWENGIGLVDESREGLVKYGRKEADMIATRANQILGKGSAVVGWLGDHMNAAAAAQNPDIKRISGTLVRTAAEAHDITPDKGDVVIRTTGRAFDIDDPTGSKTGRVTQGGVREISMHAFNELPELTAKDTKFVSDDYAKTIVDFGRADGGFSDGMSFSKAIQSNGGSALLEMPDERFAKKYVRLIDFGDVTRGGTADTPILKELQTLQKQIWSGIKEYQTVGVNGSGDEERVGRIVGRVDDLVEQYDNKVAAMSSSARSDGIAKTFGSAKMDMSGRFRIQGVNPITSYEGIDANGQVTANAEDAVKWRERANARYKEGAAYVSKNRFLEMIDQSEAQIADALDIKHVEVDGKKMSVQDLVKNDLGRQAVQSEIVKQMLDPEKSKGLYGFVNRYPTIKQSTIQALEIRIDETLGDDNRTARLAAGTAANMKADYDGDFLSTVLAHYKDPNAKLIHGELQKMQAVEAEAGRISGAAVIQDLQADMGNLAKEMNVTVGTLSRQANEARIIAKENRTTAQQSLLTRFDGLIEHSLTAKDALETREARLGKAFVGIIDNTRDKVLGLATAVMDTLETSGRASSIRVNTYRNTIEDVTAAFSQDLISSKKFSVEAETKRLMQINDSLTPQQADVQAQRIIDERHLKVADMNEYLMNLTDENRESFIRHNDEIGLFDVHSGDARTAATERVRMHSALDMIQDVQRFSAGAGGAQNPSLRVGVSEGQRSDVLRRLYSGSGDMIIPTPATQMLAQVTLESEHEGTRAIGQNMERSMTNFRRSVIQNFDNASGGADNLIDSLSPGVELGDHSLSGATVAEESATKFKDLASKFTPKALGNGGGFTGGAIAFGALWAASAMARSGPTPEGLQEQTQQPAPVPKQAMQTPTARVTQNNGEFVNIRVSAKNAQNMSEQDVAALVHQELGSMTSMKLDTTLNVNDNTQNIDQQWLQGVVANAIDKGYGF